MVKKNETQEGNDLPDVKKAAPTAHETLAKLEGGGGLRITHIEVKQDSIAIEAEQIGQRGERLEAKVKSADKPLPEFTDAIKKVGIMWCERLKVPKEWQTQHRCQGISVDYSKDEHMRLGVIVTIIVPRPDMHGVVTLNSPRMVQHIQGVAGPGARMSDQELGFVQTLIREAHRYMDGERAQQTLTVDGKSAAAGEGAEQAAAVH